ncbi:peroxisomal biogenesis factor 12 [Rhynchophorus ferrugineus]|uniref:Peroxisome assembly protein 12 n=1 Tax=Rhynchophorus ferrugineus TaxID=354439 RepID=A0A834MFX3_RHYFE|nr:hypothetical protein GWI33_003220 [Rhynchophorus ferrugineus]
MSINAANFTQTVQNKPSIFEIIAQKSLNDTLYPALQKVALFLSTNFPKKFSFLNNYYDETFLVLNGALQLYYLKFYDSSFSENFYGLKRIILNGQGLRNYERDLSLVLLVLVPYIKRKIEDKVQIYRIQNAEGSLRRDLAGWSKKTLIFSHAVFELVWGLIHLYNFLQYMGGKTGSQLPLLKVINMKLCYSNDLPPPSFWQALFKGDLKLSDLNFQLVRSGVSSILEITAFFMQFLQTWSSHSPNLSLTELPKVETPPLDNKAKTYQGKCPICLQAWSIPTVLPVSGYIFCFRCILRYLSENQKCPVTNLPARPLDIVRLYNND